MVATAGQDHAGKPMTPIETTATAVPPSRAPRAGLALLAACLSLSACAKPPAPAKAPARTVRLAQVEARALAGGLTASGLLVSREEAAVYPQITGYPVAQVLVEAGAKVAKGQPLALLDDTLLRAQIAQATASVAQQQVAAEQAASQASRVEGLEGQGVLSVEQMDQRKFQARSAKAALAAQVAQLNDLKVRDERMTIRAPVAGLVLERDVRPGDIAAQGTTPMFRMARDSLVELSADTPEAAISDIRVGDSVQVTLSDGTSVQGAVRLIQPSIDATTKLGKVLIRLPVRDDLRPGGFGRATFSATSHQAPAVPETAIRYDADGASVMVVDGADRVSQVAVKTGAHAGGYVELVQGPPVGARVLRAAASFVLPGDQINPASDAP
jgi:HlyD family secretion protein